MLWMLAHFLGVAAQVDAFEKANFVTGFSRCVEGQAQGLEPGGFKLWVTTGFDLYSPPHLGMISTVFTMAAIALATTSFWLCADLPTFTLMHVPAPMWTYVAAAALRICAGQSVVVQVEFEIANFKTRISHYKFKG
jgi:hypothetical protein